MQHRISDTHPRLRSDPGLPAAATIVGNTPEGEPATFKLDGGDGSLLRGYWTGRRPMDGDIAVTFEADNGQRWVLAWPSG
jgi:hypothetical protein